MRIDLDNPTAQQRYYQNLRWCELIGDFAGTADLLAAGPPPPQRADGYLGILSHGRVHPGPGKAGRGLWW